MQNDEYMEMLRREWEEILGDRDTTVTPEEQAELRRMLKEQEESK